MMTALEYKCIVNEPFRSRCFSSVAFFPHDRSDTNLLGGRVRTFRGRWETSGEDGKKSVVTEVGEKTWQDWSCRLLFQQKLTIVYVGHSEAPLASFGQQWQNSRINTRDANILPYLNKLWGHSCP